MLYLLDLFGTAVFAISGALAAGRKSMDLFGVVVLAIATALGGGTIRDMGLGATPLFWMTDSAYLIAATGAALLTVAGSRLTRLPRRILPVADAIGLATFTVIGTRKALELGITPGPALVMGVMTGVAGGMIRDVLSGEVPLVLRREIYATASLAGALVFVLTQSLWPTPTVPTFFGALTVLSLRLAAIRWQLSLPVFTHSSER